MSRSCPESAQGSKSYPDPNHSLKNTLPWDRPPWGSGDHKANVGKSGPQSSPPCSYTNDHNAPSQGPVLLLPVLASTIPVLLQLPACTHSGQRPPSVPQVPPVALVQRRALPSMPTTPPATAGLTQGDLGDKNLPVPLLSHPAKPTVGTPLSNLV